METQIEILNRDATGRVNYYTTVVTSRDLKKNISKSRTSYSDFGKK